MGRPRKDSDDACGKQRIKDAFWRIYRDSSINRITVKAVCEEAHINKTTFYYHYQGIDDVLSEIEDECMPFEVPLAVVDGFRNGKSVMSVFESFVRDTDRLDKVCLLLSSRGDPSFARRMKDVMKSRWCDALGIDYSALNTHDQLLIELIMGGSTSALASRGDGADFDLSDFMRVADEVITPLLDQVLRSEGASLKLHATSV